MFKNTMLAISIFISTSSFYANSETQSINEINIKALTTKALKTKSIAPKNPVVNTTAQLLFSKFFSETTCLSNENQEKLKKAIKEDVNKVIPVGVQNMIDRLPKGEIILHESQSLRAMLHVYMEKKSYNDGLHFLENSESYNVIDPFKLINRQKPNFYYRLDCSGYLGSIINTGIGISSSKLESAIKSAFDKKEFYQASRAIMYPVITKAMDPLGTGVSGFNNESSSAILFPLLSSLEQRGLTEFWVPRYMDVIAYERNSNKSIQGEIKISGGASYSVGVAKGSVDINGSAELTENFSFSDPNTAIIETGELVKYSKENLLERLKESLSNISFSVNSKIPLIIHSDLYSQVCSNAGWTADLKNNGTIIAKDIKIRPSTTQDKKCLFEIDTNGLDIQMKNLTVVLKPSSSILTKNNVKIEMSLPI